MRLTKVEIQGFRSIRQKFTLPIDQQVTVLLGANDHGKTNVLSALMHLNPDESFGPDDPNWDIEPDDTSLPSVKATFVLTREERLFISALQEQGPGAQSTEAEEPQSKDSVASPPSDADQGAALDQQTTDVQREPSNPTIGEEHGPSTLTFERTGLNGKLSLRTKVRGMDDSALSALMSKFYPRFEIIPSIQHLPDAVTAIELPTRDFEFMQGIFLFADLEKKDWPELFSATDKTRKRLAKASKRLNTTLTKSWTQGGSLEFVLAHGKEERIELMINDPAVEKRYVRASKRSAGFTNFFAIKTILHARQAQSPAQSYIWLFDEVGAGLHPAGQHDLLQVFEALSAENQVIYTTHSLFLINKNYPTRHRLIAKTKRGTLLDSKPYASRWQAALEALGLALPATILFSSHILLTEGDADPILLLAVLQKLVALDKITADLNLLGIMSTGESKNADVLIRMLAEAKPRPALAAVFDGDDGGRRRIDKLDRLMNEQNVTFWSLADGTTTEDHIIDSVRLYPEATARYVARWQEFDEAKTASLVSDVAAAASTELNTKRHAGIARWSQTKVAEVAGLDDSDFSKVGVAREYALLLADYQIDVKAKIDLPIALATKIAEALKLPDRAAEQTTILDEESDEEASGVLA